ncbi:MAG TPA: type II secretion system protein [Candidatus Paceibacterota bacterium]
MKKGFTLIEIIVSLAIFTIVALIAVGALLRIMDANKKSITLKTTINNMNFALESISREMRVGSNYYCSSSIPGSLDNLSNDCSHIKDSSWTVAFNSSKTSTVGGDCNLIYAYRYEDYTLKKAQQTDCTSSLDFTPLISPDISIDSTIIKVDNTSQPRVFLLLKGHNGEREREKTTFVLQTTISQRIK